MTFLICWAAALGSLGVALMVVPWVLLKVNYGVGLGKFRDEAGIAVAASLIEAVIFWLVIAAGKTSILAWLIVGPITRRSGFSHTMLAGVAVGYLYYFMHQRDMDWWDPVIIVVGQLMVYLTGYWVWWMVWGTGMNGQW